MVSIGDSAHEREALIDVAKDMGLEHIKILKMSDRPNPKQLQREHEFMQTFLDKILRYPGCLDLQIGQGEYNLSNHVLN